MLTEKTKTTLSCCKYIEDVIYRIQAFIITTEVHKLQMINKIGLLFYVADFAEKRNFYEFKDLLCIAAQKPQQKNSRNGKFIISSYHILNIKRLFHLVHIKIIFWSPPTLHKAINKWIDRKILILFQI